MLNEQEIFNIIIGGARHPNYDETVKLAKELRIHTKGEYPYELIDERRPNEAEESKKYRKSVYQAITKKEINKVLTSIGKIRRSPDWMIKHKPEEVPYSIPENERLYEYTEHRYPVYTSLTNWAFEEYVPNTIDANALVAVIPLFISDDASVFIQPVAEIFGSEQVLWYTPNKNAVLLSNEIEEKVYESGITVEKNIYYYIDTEIIVRYISDDSKTGYHEDYNFNHGFGRLPAFKIGGKYLKKCKNDIIYDSFLSPMVPSLNEAVREFSDLQASVVQHLYPEKYIFMDNTCENCNGTGTAHLDDGTEHGKMGKCPVCNGEKIRKLSDVSPFGMYIINPGKKLDDIKVPNPPIDYVKQDTSIIELQDRRIKDHLRDALSAVNMEFLADVPMKQSGVAKEVDRDELNAFINAYAENIVKALDTVYYFENEYRYSKFIEDKDIRKKQLPDIPVPERYDILSLANIISDLEAAKRANVDPFTLRKLHEDYIRKKFNAEPDLANQLLIKSRLDPLIGYSVDDKLKILDNGDATRIDGIISFNITAFIDRAEFEHKNFYDLSFDKQREILKGYAETVIEETDAGNEIRDDISDIVPIDQETE